MSRERDPAPDGLELELEALLGDARERAAARAALTRAPGGAERLAALARVLDEAGEELRDGALPHASRSARFVARVLARTTRQDLSWRGDLRLALDFLRGRLRASPALRLVAVLLALQLVAAPALALWVALRRTDAAPFTIHVELPREEPFGAPVEPPPDAPDELAAAARAREARENARARERWVLGTRARGAPRAALAPDAPVELALLDARAERLARGAADAPPLAPDGLAPLALALWVELALDRLVLAPDGADAGLGPAALRLAELVRTGGLAPGTAELARAALHRAAALGVLADPLAEGAAAPGLLEPAWFEALGRAAAEHGLDGSATVAAWLAWGGR